MHALTRHQTVLLVLLTLVWGMNWPVMKFGVTGYPPLSFRAICIVLGLPLIAAILVWRKVPFYIAREHWPELLKLAVFNMFFWHTLAILAVQSLSSGRAAIVGYTMPIFSALIGAALFGQRLPSRAWGGVAAAGLGVAFLLWHEITTLAGRPTGVAMMLLAAGAWALGTQMLRHSRLPYPILAISFWMTALTLFWIAGWAVVFEHDRWTAPSLAIWGSIAYNAVGVYAFAQVAWLSLARDLPPIASTLSVMLIPVLGAFSGAWWLGEQLHWQDWAAVALVLTAIAAVLAPARQAHQAGQVHK